jgi:hypothetical protein
MGCAERLRTAACVAACAVALPVLAQQAAAPWVTPVRPIAGAVPAPAVPLPAGRWTVAQVQQAFALADSNSDGQLTRAEAQQLAILPRSFEELDQNKDGALTRDEYQLGVL